MKIRNLLAICIVLGFTSVAFSQETKTDDTTVAEPVTVIDRLNIPGPLKFGENEFFLALSKQNSPTWVQQQYIMRDDDLNNYKELVNISYFDKEIDMETAIRQKLDYVEKRLSNDKYTFKDVTDSPDGKEVIVDYLTTDTPKEGEPFAEYNLDRFKTIDAGTEKKFIIFSYSKRIAGDLKYAARALSKERSKLMETAIKTTIPPVTYKPTEVDKKKK